MLSNRPRYAQETGGSHVSSTLSDADTAPRLFPSFLPKTRCDASAMASMLQDPNLQQLMAQYMETTERDNECFAAPGFVASLFRPQNMQAIAAMETAMNAMVGAGHCRLR